MEDKAHPPGIYTNCAKMGLCQCPDGVIVRPGNESDILYPSQGSGIRHIKGRAEVAATHSPANYRCVVGRRNQIFKPVAVNILYFNNGRISTHRNMIGAGEIPLPVVHEQRDIPRPAIGNMVIDHNQVGVAITVQIAGSKVQRFILHPCEGRG